MRPIKFRAWVPALRQMWAVAMIDWSEDDIHNGGTHAKLSDVKIMQFTGLHDKNGREICEGDIIECEYHEGMADSRGNVWRGVVTWGEDASFHTERLHVEHNCLYSVRYGGSAIKRWEVIGNIYENPELVKAEVE